jgi:putative iron-regulated protein
MKNILKMFLLGLLSVAAVSCDDDDADGSDTGDEQESYDYSAILKSTVEAVIIPTYKDLSDAATDLHEAVEALAEETSEDNLKAARDAWVAARIPWEQSEAFLFGPVADQGLDPALDSWPVDYVQLDQVLESGLDLTPDSILENLGGGLKGFHTIEYLLWDEHDKEASDFEKDPREIEYLIAVTEGLMNDAETLHKAWASGKEDKGFEGFGETFYLAGQEGGRYYSQTDAVQQLINGMVDICDEVANGKIGDPYEERDVSLVESQFSFNSIQDFTDNMRSVQNIYLGTYKDAGSPGLTDFVSETDSDLDARVKSEIEASISAIEAITDDPEKNPFRDAVMDSAKDDEIEAAQEAIQAVMDTLNGEVMGLLFD